MYLSLVNYTVLAAVYILFRDVIPMPFGALVKILPILLLMRWAWLEADSYRLLLILALGFGMGGDIAMAFSLFIPGLALFLVGHLFYIALWSRQLDYTRYWRLLPLLLLTAVGAYFLMPHTGEMIIYVAVYFFVITLMAAAATLSRLVNVFGIVGVYSFIVSDFIIGWNQFIEPLQWSPTVIMLTYYLAQLLMLVTVIQYQKRSGEFD